MTDFFLILFSTALINNVIVIQVIGVDPALAFSRKLDVASGLSLSLLVLLPVVTVTGYLIDTWLIVPFSIEYLRLLLFVLLIFIISMCIKLWLHKIHAVLDSKINVFFPYTVINTTVLGTMLFNQQFSNSVVPAFAYGMGTAVGFSIVLLALTAITERLEVSDVPDSFQGTPIVFITLSLLSMAFLGLIGLAFT